MDLSKNFALGGEFRNSVIVLLVRSFDKITCGQVRDRVIEYWSENEPDRVISTIQKPIPRNISPKKAQNRNSETEYLEKKDGNV